MYLTQWNWIAMPDPTSLLALIFLSCINKGCMYVNGLLQLCLTIRYELVLLQLNLNSDHDCECSWRLRNAPVFFRFSASVLAIIVVIFAEDINITIE